METFESLNPEAIAKLRTVIKEGAKIKLQIKDLSDGLKETIKEISTQLEVPVSLINKAVKIEFLKDENSNVLEEQKDDLNDLEALIDLIQ